MQLIVTTILACLWKVSRGQDLELTVIHVNDFHAHFNQFDKYNTKCDAQEASEGACYGGIARLYTEVQRVKTSEPNVVYVNGGDEYQGTLWFNMFKYKPYLEFLNLLRYDAMALGNHEFDATMTDLMPLIEGLNFPIVDANIDFSEDPVYRQSSKKIQKSIVIMRAGQKIGIIGFTTSKTPSISNPGEHVKFLDEVTSIQEEARRLTQEGVKIIIAVGHSGFEIDKKIAMEVEEVDVVVGGHTNTFLYSGTPPPPEDADKVEGPYPVVIREGRMSPALVVQDYTFAKYLGYLKVTFNGQGQVVSWSGNPILLDKNVEQSEFIKQRMLPYERNLTAKGSEEICRNIKSMSKAACRNGQCALANLLTDGIREWYKQENEPNPEQIVALVNGGGVRNDFGEGNITYADVISTFPFGNTVSLYKIKGKHLWTVLEDSASKIGSGGLLHTSGLKAVIDVAKPEGERLLSASTCGWCRVGDASVPLRRDDTEYVLATISFLARGGNDHLSISDHAKVYKNQDFVDLEIVLEYIKGKTLDEDKILDDRLEIVRSGFSEASSSSHLQVPSIFIISMMMINLVSITTVRQCFKQVFEVFY